MKLSAVRPRWGRSTLLAAELEISREWCAKSLPFLRPFLHTAISELNLTNCYYYYGDFCTIIIIDTIFILSWNIEVIPVIFIKHMSSNFISIDSLSSWSHHPVFRKVMSVSAVQAQDVIVRYWLMPCSAAVIVSPSPPCSLQADCSAACCMRSADPSWLTRGINAEHITGCWANTVP